MKNHSFSLYLYYLLLSNVVYWPLPSLFPLSVEYKTHAKKVLKLIISKPDSPAKCILQVGDYYFYYSIDKNVLYLTLAERNYPRRLAFEYLNELSISFSEEFGLNIHSFNRPYAAVSYDTTMEKIRNKYSDPQAPANYQRINNALIDMHGIMTQNIQEIIHRGEKLERRFNI